MSINDDQRSFLGVAIKDNQWMHHQNTTYLFLLKRDGEFFWWCIHRSSRSLEEAQKASKHQRYRNLVDQLWPGPFPTREDAQAWLAWASCLSPLA